MVKSLQCIGCAVAVTAFALGTGRVLADGSVTVSVDVSNVIAEVPRTLYGTGMEDVNHEICGGLDAQRLYDESFEEQEIGLTAGNGARRAVARVGGVARGGDAEAL